MDSVLDRLEEHDARARVVIEGLRAEAERAAGELASADESLSRLVITRETVLEVLGAGSDQDSGTGGEGGRGVGRDMALYERISRVFAKAGTALRPRQVCEELGIPTEAKFIEAMRPKLARLVADGVLVQVGPGLFTPVAAGSVAFLASSQSISSSPPRVRLQRERPALDDCFTAARQPAAHPGAPSVEIPLHAAVNPTVNPSAPLIQHQDIR